MLEQTLPAGPGTALAHAYRASFTSALTEILLIAAAIAFVGSLLALALVRGRDFVAPSPAAHTEAGGAVPAPAAG